MKRESKAATDEKPFPLRIALRNPAGQFVWLECPAPGIEQALVRDAEGQLFWHSGALRGASQIRIDLAAWPPGVFGCEVLQSGGQRVFARLVVWR
ncbi:MAG TPA: hypothetical protein PKL15_13845 [Saprospiraceae bacterium]|nr:hypothetical protein [Saprospiraceae bacterium]